MTVLILNMLLLSHLLDLSVPHFPSLSMTHLVLSFFLHCFCCYRDVVFTRHHKQDWSMQVQVEKQSWSLWLASQKEVTSAFSTLPLGKEHERNVKQSNWAVCWKQGVCHSCVGWQPNKIRGKNKVIPCSNHNLRIMWDIRFFPISCNLSGTLLGLNTIGMRYFLKTCKLK